MTVHDIVKRDPWHTTNWYWENRNYNNWSYKKWKLQLSIAVQCSLLTTRVENGKVLYGPFTV